LGVPTSSVRLSNQAKSEHFWRIVLLVVRSYKLGEKAGVISGLLNHRGLHGEARSWSDGLVLLGGVKGARETLNIELCLMNRLGGL
jgi:hypothetical protein